MRTILNYLIGRRKTIDEVLTIDETISLLESIIKNHPKLRMNVAYIFLTSLGKEHDVDREMIYSAEESVAFVKQKFDKKSEKDNYRALHEVYSNKRIEKHYFLLEYRNWIERISEEKLAGEVFSFYRGYIDFLIKKEVKIK